MTNDSPGSTAGKPFAFKIIIVESKPLLPERQIVMVNEYRGTKQYNSK